MRRDAHGSGPKKFRCQRLLPITRRTESFYRGLFCFSDHVRLSCYGDNIGSRLPDRRIHSTTTRLVPLKPQTQNRNSEISTEQQKRKGPSLETLGPLRDLPLMSNLAVLRRSNCWRKTASVCQAPIFFSFLKRWEIITRTPEPIIRKK